MIGSGLTRFRDFGLLLLRIGLGVAFIFHGYPKLFGGPHTWEAVGGMANIEFYPVVFGFIGACIEFFGGILLILGFLFRPVCLLLAAQMAVALFAHHLPHGDPYGVWSHPMEDGIVFLCLLLIGPGAYSIDRK
jgi:putative oxidoreductase